MQRKKPVQARLKMVTLKQVISLAAKDKMFYAAMMRDPKSAIAKNGMAIEPVDLRTLKTLIQKTKTVRRGILDLQKYALSHDLGGGLSRGGTIPPPPEPPWPWPGEDWVYMPRGPRARGRKR